jgi:hypothetical protein
VFFHHLPGFSNITGIYRGGYLEEASIRWRHSFCNSAQRLPQPTTCQKETWMTTIDPHRKFLRPASFCASASLMLPLLLAGCGGQQASTPPPPVNDFGGAHAPAPVGQAPARHGLTGRQKVAILVGAAALYYLYRKHQKEAAASGQNVQYYRSKSTGQIYYRDPKTHQAHFVTPPASGIQVPEADAGEYRDYQGYNNQTTGRGVNDLPIPVG